MIRAMNNRGTRKRDPEIQTVDAKPSIGLDSHRKANHPLQRSTSNLERSSSLPPALQRIFPFGAIRGAPLRGLCLIILRVLRILHTREHRIGVKAQVLWSSVWPKAERRQELPDSIEAKPRRDLLARSKFPIRRGGCIIRPEFLSDLGYFAMMSGFFWMSSSIRRAAQHQRLCIGYCT